MVSEHEITATLNGLIEDFVDRVSFFKAWKKGDINLPMSRKFLESFDYLVKSFPVLIAAGAAKAEDEATRATLATNLYQECGEGDLSRTHHAIYRKFLVTAGIDVSKLPSLSFTEDWKGELSFYIATANPASALGALAAGEFLAQPALSRIFSVLKPLYPRADDEYFTKHLVLETEHVKEITVILEPLAQRGQWEAVLAGFERGLSVWETYFDQLTVYLEADSALKN